MVANENDIGDISLLYVEDEADARQMVRDMIARKYRNLNLQVAENGAAGLDLFRTMQPEIVITDLSMPVMDGIVLSREIRQLNPETFIIAITAHSDTGYLLSAIDIGINHYILKPIVSLKLFKALDTCIEAIRVRRLLKTQNEHIRKLSSAVEGSPCSVMITDAQGTIEYVNPKFCSVSGYAAADVIGRNQRIMKSGLTPLWTYEELWTTITAGREWHGELFNRKKNGDLFWESVSISPICDASGGTAHFIVIKEDITERKAAAEQIELLNAELALTAADLEAFNYTVSHDLRTPVAIISGYCQMIQEHHSHNLEGKCREYFREIQTTTQRMDQLINSLLDFAHLSRRELHRQTVDMSKLVRSVAAELRQLAPERQVTMTVQEGISREGDPRLLRVLVENLLGNSWKYTSMKEHAEIEFGEMEYDGWPTCFVRDNGIGFDMAAADQLFMPFQRLPGSDGYAGTGIGLATVHRIVQRHDGTIWAEAEQGSGATFYFTLG